MRSMRPPRLGRVEVAAGVHFGQHPAQAGVFLFDGIHRRVHFFADFGVFGLRLQGSPTGGGRHKKDVFGAVLVVVFGGRGPLVGGKPGGQAFKGAGDVAQEGEAEDDVFVFGGVDVFAQFVGGFSQLGFEGVAWAGFFLFGLSVPVFKICGSFGFYGVLRET